MAKKTAIQKLNVDKQTHTVSPIPEGFPGWKDASSMVVSTPLEVDSIVRKVPEGRLVTLTEIRAYLAQQYGTDIACPVSTAIYLNIVAAAAEEMREQGESHIAPYWRVLKPDGKLNEKYPGGVEAQKAKLEAEGYTLVALKSGYRVQDYQEFLAAL
ncbi:MAG: MGMT family protein [Chloroflexota bacterium]|nr:MGMT family protein [Chloroflexota bacterium]